MIKVLIDRASIKNSLVSLYTKPWIKAKGLRTILFVCFVCAQLGCAQRRLIKQNELLIYGEALKGSPVYDPTVYVFPNLLANITAFFPENSKRHKLSMWVAENNWSFIYQKMKVRMKERNTKLSAKKILAAVGKFPMFAVQERNGSYSPVLMNDEMTKALVISVNIGGSAHIFFELKDNKWTVVKYDSWLD